MMAHFSPQIATLGSLSTAPEVIKPIGTAIPAFIGYTPKADLHGHSYFNIPVKVSSFSEFKKIFLFDQSLNENQDKKPYHPSYHLVEQNEVHALGKYIHIDEKPYAVLPDPTSIYYFYNCIRHFFQNGGVEAYIVSVGPYGKKSNNPLTHPKQRIVNPHVKLHELLTGLSVLQNETEPTIYVCPEGTLLSISDNATLMQAMLVQAQEMQSTICLFDVIGGEKSHPINLMQDIQVFRHSLGEKGLNHGVSYFPFVGTALMSAADFDFSNMFDGSLKTMAPLLEKKPATRMILSQLIEASEINSPNKLNPAQRHKALQQYSAIYSEFTKHIVDISNIIPTSSAMAGVYAMNDKNAGVWNDPVNVNIAGTNRLPIALNAFQQSFLHFDQTGSKPINTLHFLNTLGVLVWGARTLKGNHPQLQSISAQRTASYIQKKIHQFSANFSHYPNAASTWSLMQTAIENFLHDIWIQGGLIGSLPHEAFQVKCGNNIALTQHDMADDQLRIQLKLALTKAQQFHEFDINLRVAF
jgi:phage tail sheath protein FI